MPIVAEALAQAATGASLRSVFRQTNSTLGHLLLLLHHMTKYPDGQRWYVPTDGGISRNEGSSLEFELEMIFHFTIVSKGIYNAVRVLANVTLPLRSFILHKCSLLCKSYLWVCVLQGLVRVCFCFVFCSFWRDVEVNCEGVVLVQRGKS